MGISVTHPINFRVVKHKLPGEHTPGRQVILFLLWANLSIFVYYCVQTIQSIFTNTVVGTMPSPYNWIIALALPFVLFYRFHSSAVFAELYKHHCSEGKAVGHNGEAHGSTHEGHHGGPEVMGAHGGGRVRNIPIHYEH